MLPTLHTVRRPHFVFESAVTSGQVLRVASGALAASSDLSRNVTTPQTTKPRMSVAKTIPHASFRTPIVNLLNVSVFNVLHLKPTTATRYTDRGSGPDLNLGTRQPAIPCTKRRYRVVGDTGLGSADHKTYRSHRR